ncbi:tRNA lysidine(34) synthetase TilS [Acuticoccus yangtzensis]|uniref:tRNA lysidine(34) synthetase TilS n=1 Tax=Acuticoccus yangtzensis TaxID=1443441 RepID=UPI000949860B|nr:tRNA lysidine(34) synthetase TilS [Acuticoccus yangtzensis]
MADHPAGPARCTGPAVEAGTACPAPDLAALDLDLVDRIDGPIGLAVSGGSDSVALALLLTEARPTRDFTLLTVDHGLRAEAAAECAAVAALAARLGRPCIILRVTGTPRGSVQAWAREARYGLFAEAAAAHGLAAVATGHTMDDQAETLLMRLARGSGLRGLGAMRPDTRHHGVRIVRPLLSLRREALRQMLHARGVTWTDDPSNADPAYERIAMRRLAAPLATAGLTPESLAAAAAHLARASAFVDGEAEALLQRCVRTARTGGLAVDRALWCAAHEEVRLRALAHAVAVTGGSAAPPAFATLAEADRVIAAGGTTTLGRVVVRSNARAAQIWRERRGIVPVTLAPGATAEFDGRYRVTAAQDGAPVRVAAAGPAARRWVCPADIPAAAETMPALFDASGLAAYPLIGVRRRDWPQLSVVVEPLREAARFGPLRYITGQ